LQDVYLNYWNLCIDGNQMRTLASSA